MSSYIHRTLDLPTLLSQKSFFLFGPRTTGKSSLIARQCPDAHVFDLLDAATYKRLLKRPSLLAEEAPHSEQTIVIDEIQKLPSLLDEVHRLISSAGRRFLLTGSSARKLRRGAANLLAGRAWRTELFPLTAHEIPDFDLLRYINRGGLPDVYLGQNPSEELANYVALYLQEEVSAEALTRNLPAFAAFLDAIALSNGEEVNFESLASDCGVSPKTVKNYVQILDDTLLGFALPGFTKTKKRKAIGRLKYYLFDVGVVHSLCQRGEIHARSELFGKAFEHFIMQEVRAYLGYSRIRLTMSYWRSTSQFEVDLVLQDRCAIEVKATSLVNDKHLKGLRALKEEGLQQRYIVVSTDPNPRLTSDGIHILPWQHFVAQLWRGDILGETAQPHTNGS